MKRGNHSKSRASKGLVLMVALVLVFGVAVGGTIAWLTDQTPEIKNTFTTSDVSITLTETTGTEYHMIPGHTITKDPVVTVGNKSEPCWLFVKVVKSTDFDTFMEYNMANGWTALDTTNHPGVFYQAGVANDGKVNAGESYPVIANNTLTVSGELTVADMERITGHTMNVIAYACQYMESNTANFTADEAWHIVSGEPADTNP